MADTANITTNVVNGSNLTSNLSTDVTLSTSVTESTTVSANVVTGGKGDKGDTGNTGATGASGPTGPQGPAGNDGLIQSVDAGNNISVDSTDPANPIISATGVVRLTGNESIDGTKTFLDGVSVGEGSALDSSTVGGMDAPFGTIAGNNAVQRIIAYHGTQQYVSKRGPAMWYISDTSGNNETNVMSAEYDRLNMNNHRITNILTPTDPSDAATKGYVDGSGYVSSNTATSVDSEIALFSGTGGKTIKRASGSGLAKLTSGVLSIASAGTDYSTSSATETLTNKTIDGSQLVNTSVSASKLNLGPQTSYVSTDQGTTSTTYTDLATVQSVTVTIGANGLALVHFSAGLYNVAASKRMSVAVSGASTVAASDDWSIRNDMATFSGLQGMTHLFTGLTAGSNTFTLKFKTASGTGQFFERRITVLPL